MVALFVYAYAIGERSSRGIERRCRDDVAFRVITANQARITPQSRFRVRYEAAIAGLFGEVPRVLVSRVEGALLARVLHSVRTQDCGSASTRPRGCGAREDPSLARA